ncbi:MAG: hypothetical protein NTY35_01435 [Planctomycetota bacterium]|nr:hypothetical protein [Planctomycetota bacterium]
MRSILSIALLFLAACGGSDPKSLSSEGYAALGKGDAKSALTKFDAALQGLEATHPEYLRASLGRCEALARTDGAGAKAAFLDLAKKLPAKVGEGDYGLVCSAMLQGGFTLDAIDVMDAGNKRFPTSAKMKATHDAVVAAANREATPEALKKLDSLGYAGGGK